MTFMTSAVSRFLLLGVPMIAGCDLWSSLTTPSPAEVSNYAQCRNYVAYLNSQTCLGLSYEPDNFCEGVNGHDVDLAPFYQCLQEQARCENGEATLNFDACAPPLASQRPSPPPDAPMAPPTARSK